MTVETLNEQTPQQGSMRETTVQRLMFPDASVNTEEDLFFHSSGVAGFDTERRAFYALATSEITFNSYFNAFPVHHFDLTDDHTVSLKIRAEGTYLVEIILARISRSWDRLLQTRLTTTRDDVTVLNVPKVPLDGMLFVRVRALTDITIEDLDFCISGPLLQDVSITGVITTFKRDAAVQKTGARLEEYFKDNADIADRFRLLVIDNGGDTDSVPFSGATVIKNKNYGGAGGFTRGLLEVVENNLSSHVLFMDDDASFFPESLRRTLSVLRFSSRWNLAISGAMITEMHKWRMWENGAVFNRKCMPIDSGRDLRSFGEVLSMSNGQPRNVENKYAGWWYFCFPVNAVETWPFPFFVRGDDSYFSLSNRFDIITVSGVASHQEDFFSKQSPLTVYLDMRYHLVHHLTFDRIAMGRVGFLKMLNMYFYRFNNSYHYETAAAINQAIEDVLAGPRFWEDNIDMAARRGTIGALTQDEKVRDELQFPGQHVTPHSKKRNKGPFYTWLRKATYNGHMLPAFLFYKKGVEFALDVRGVEHDTFLRPFTVTRDPANGRGYQTKLNKDKYFANLKRFKTLSGQVEKNYDDLIKTYHEATGSLTTREMWAKRLKDQA